MSENEAVEEKDEISEISLKWSISEEAQRQLEALARLNEVSTTKYVETLIHKQYEYLKSDIANTDFGSIKRIPRKNPEGILNNGYFPADKKPKKEETPIEK